MNRENQAKDQFEEILKMRLNAAEPNKNKFNILEYMPRDVIGEEKIALALKKKKAANIEEGSHLVEGEMELHLEDDSEEKEEPIID